MKNRRILIVAVLAFFALPLICKNYLGEPVESTVAAAEPERCRAKPDLARAVHELSSGQSFRQLEHVRLQLTESATLSATCRKEVIAVIIAAMDKPQLDVYRDFNLWRYGSHVLGDLKATEGLDLLIKHLNFTDGTSINVTHYPAMGAVIKIGRPAIHRLGTALRQNSDVGYRYNAVFCLAQIGGPKATQELTAALSSESNSCVRKFMQTSIKALSDSKSPGKIATDERDAWFAALSCKE